MILTGFTIIVLSFLLVYFFGIKKLPSGRKERQPNVVQAGAIGLVVGTIVIFIKLMVLIWQSLQGYVFF